MSFLAIKWVQNGLKKEYIEMRFYFYFEIILKFARTVTLILLSHLKNSTLDQNELDGLQDLCGCAVKNLMKKLKNH